MKTYKIQPGWRYPFGATVDAKGVNFSIWGYQATSVELLLYEHAQSATPFQVIWHAVLPQVRGGLAATALFVFILTWSDFLLALVLTS